MNFLHLSLLITLVFYETTHARYQRRPARAPFMTALQNMLGPGKERLLMANRQPIAEVVTRNQMGMPNTMMTKDGMPNMRVIQPKCPCQMETPCRRIQEMPALPRMPVPNMPVVPAPAAVAIAPAAPAAMGPVMFAPPMPEIAISYPVPNVAQEPCPCREPAVLVSPFLPAASPVSAMAPPTSNLLPPVIPNQNRHHFLRKIPIPPPTL